MHIAVPDATAVNALLGLTGSCNDCTIGLMKLSMYLEANGIRTADFAKLVGFDRTTVQRWKREETCPDSPAMKRIFELTGGLVTPNDFIIGCDGRQPASEAAE